jgi:hypothetical protein
VSYKRPEVPEVGTIVRIQKGAEVYPSSGKTKKGCAWWTVPRSYFVTVTQVHRELGKVFWTSRKTLNFLQRWGRSSSMPSDTF